VFHRPAVFRWRHGEPLSERCVEGADRGKARLPRDLRHLEVLCRVKMPFIFKGGTSLLILLDEPRRLSTDIDIIVAPGTDVDGFIQQAGQIFPFRDVT